MSICVKYKLNYPYSLILKIITSKQNNRLLQIIWRSINAPFHQGKSSLSKLLCSHYGSSLLDMNVLAADVRETEQQKHVAQVRDDAKVTFLNQIREQIQNAAQIVVESGCFYDKHY